MNGLKVGLGPGYFPGFEVPLYKILYELQRTKKEALQHKSLSESTLIK